MAMYVQQHISHAGLSAGSVSKSLNGLLEARVPGGDDGVLLACLLVFLLDVAGVAALLALLLFLHPY